jgi:hypothetical protein
MKKFIFLLNYFHAPVVKRQTDDFLMLEGIRNKVWNPVFTVGAITFFLSMTLRGFFNQVYAVIPLGISTIVLVSGVWILSAAALIVFDKNESKIYCIYKHLGYLQKIYSYPLTSVDEIFFQQLSNRKVRLQLLKDDGTFVLIARWNDEKLLKETAQTVSAFLNKPLVVMSNND